MSIQVLLNTNRDKKKKKHSCHWQDDTIHAYKSLYLHCSPSTKVSSKLKSIDENEDS